MSAGHDAGRHGGWPDPLGFIRANMRLVSVPTLPEIRLYTAHPATGLCRLASLRQDGSEPSAPYWAYHWPGGAALARHILDWPETVTGGRVLDLGAGSGIVGIAAAKSGARRVIAAEIDRYALAALTLNAAVNGVEITTISDDITAGPPPPMNLVAVGDDLAARVTAFLDRCLAARINVLIGDPGRSYLPRRASSTRRVSCAGRRRNQGRYLEADRRVFARAGRKSRCNRLARRCAARRAATSAPMPGPIGMSAILPERARKNSDGECHRGSDADRWKRGPPSL
jgi:predicted nicotinamide N-methyase